ncbi:hypothetical protein CTT31_23325 [Pseudoalteromonas maricaloris]|uniref:hypothetical protein n=1 Tax=Pseudoalteromonas TaxID=53246 RepID=UPI001EFE1113|nr:MULTISPECIES: hypothetical protein [Pseudoalteromonas]MCG9770777.1 hypothetical protein [Pseudoalteromonas piscicida]USE72000.1 hypothetical protein CTT31_23325 [Pseudoalteromonas flavipulchra]
MKSIFNLALLTCIGAAVLVSLMSAPFIEVAMSLMLIGIVCLAKNDDNSQLLTMCFASVFILSSFAMYILKNFVIPSVEGGYVQNIYAYSTQLVLSLLLLFLLKHRMTIAVLLTRGKSASVFERNYAEGPLYLLVIFLVFVDFMALMENFIRNLEHLGINEETAKIFWEWTFFYDYFAYLKAVPMLLCVTLLYVGLVVRTKRQPIQN